MLICIILLLSVSHEFFADVCWLNRAMRMEQRILVAWWTPILGWNGAEGHRVRRGWLLQKSRHSRAAPTYSWPVSLGKVWWRWVQGLIPQPPSAPLCLLVCTASQQGWLRNPCRRPYLPFRPFRPCLLLASPSPPWASLWLRPQQWTAEMLLLRHPTGLSSPPAEGRGKEVTAFPTERPIKPYV